MQPAELTNLTPWKSGFGSVKGGDADGDADGPDFLMWQRKATAGSSAAAVAEPVSAMPQATPPLQQPSGFTQPVLS